MVRENSRHFAGRVIDSVGGDIPRQIEEVYLRALCRMPSEEETKKGARTSNNSLRTGLATIKRLPLPNPNP